MVMSVGVFRKGFALSAERRALRKTTRCPFPAAERVMRAGKSLFVLVNLLVWIQETMRAHSESSDARASMPWEQVWPSR